MWENCAGFFLLDVKKQTIIGTLGYHPRNADSQLYEEDENKEGRVYSEKPVLRELGAC